jgi:hypothetical protein
VSQIVNAAERLDPYCYLSGLPVAIPKVVQVEVAATLGREEQVARTARR